MTRNFEIPSRRNSRYPLLIIMVVMVLTHLDDFSTFLEGPSIETGWYVVTLSLGILLWLVFNFAAKPKKDLVSVADGQLYFQACEKDGERPSERVEVVKDDQLTYQLYSSRKSLWLCKKNVPSDLADLLNERIGAESRVK